MEKFFFFFFGGESDDFFMHVEVETKCDGFNTGYGYSRLCQNQRLSVTMREYQG